MILGGRTQEEIMQVRLKCQWKEGFMEGFKKAFKEGYEEAFKEGLREVREEIFISMLHDGIDPERAAKLAKIPPERARKLAAELKRREGTQHE